MSDRITGAGRDDLDPVLPDDDQPRRRTWSDWLLYFLRVMAVGSMAKGLYHWAVLSGLWTTGDGGFEVQSLSWQTATVFFAIFDLVAAVGLWLAAPWGAVVWLTSAISLMAVEFAFPQVYGTHIEVLMLLVVLIVIYLVLAINAAREHPY
ncbi:MAG: hypothetical protein HY056_07300 [Proteobacteria bacterium]|nr:hypothetical protein [Pseudomonadota bacterium]